MRHSVFICLPTEGQLSYFLLGAIMNQAAVNLCEFLCGHKFLTQICKYLEAQLLDCMVSSKEVTKLFSKVVALFCIPTSNEWEVLLLHILTST